ncbi:MAG: hypothetical protein JWQ35_281 [Bacteriovoracaceae bacterium]|nr:hypothetical protein [Bacteriovoracaceae bacterium]
MRILFFISFLFTSLQILFAEELANTDSKLIPLVKEKGEGLSSASKVEWYSLFYGRKELQESWLRNMRDSVKKMEPSRQREKEEANLNEIEQDFASMITLSKQLNFPESESMLVSKLIDPSESIKTGSLVGLIALNKDLAPATTEKIYELFKESKPGSVKAAAAWAMGSASSLTDEQIQALVREVLSGWEWPTRRLAYAALESEVSKAKDKDHFRNGVVHETLRFIEKNSPTQFPDDSAHAQQLISDLKAVPIFLEIESHDPDASIRKSATELKKFKREKVVGGGFSKDKEREDGLEFQRQVSGNK